jgi:hypothetical protein
MDPNRSQPSRRGKNAVTSWTRLATIPSVREQILVQRTLLTIKRLAEAPGHRKPTAQSLADPAN